MKKLTSLTFILALIVAFSASAAEKEWKYVNAQNLRIVNKGWTNSAGTYSRLPANMKDSVPPELWHLAQESAGIAIRFATDSKNIGVKYSLKYDSHMPHMADTGIKGTDLYIWEGDSCWRHVNTNRPVLKDKEKKICEAVYLENFDGKMHEYMIYLPLYDGVENLYVKIDKDAKITTGSPNLIKNKRRIVAYGTSILQGGCASRTGMCATNIISRELNVEVINLGFSGQGKMHYAMARAMASIPDVEVFLIDPVPNCTEQMCNDLTYNFINIIRKARPDAKIVMVEGPMYPYSRYNSYFKKYLPKKNAAYRKNFDRLKRENPKNLYYVTCNNLDGLENDGTVDGIHLTDLGFRHYANKLVPVLRTVMSK